MRITTQNLPNSFSSSNKKQKAALPETAPRASVLAKATSRSQLTIGSRRSNHEQFTLLPTFRTSGAFTPALAKTLEVVPIDCISVGVNAEELRDNADRRPGSLRAAMERKS